MLRVCEAARRRFDGTAEHNFCAPRRTEYFRPLLQQRFLLYRKTEGNLLAVAVYFRAVFPRGEFSARPALAPRARRGGVCFPPARRDTSRRDLALKIVVVVVTNFQPSPRGARRSVLRRRKV